MLHVRAELSFMVLFDQCSFLVFHLAAVFTLMHSCSGQSQVIGPLQPAVALIGDDIILPCKLDPVMDALDMTVEWSRPDLDPRFVLVWRDGVELESKKNPSYTNRTSLFTDELKNGNISLKISKVKLSDEGKYKCFVPELEKHTAVQLIVGSASSISAWINSTISSSRVVLQCKSAGWYPEPELLWLDGEGNLLSAGPTETLRGPDDLYTVSSRVTVEKRHSNNITCRVQQRNTNQSRETHIHVPDDFFMVISPSSPPSKPASHPNIIIGVVIVALVVLILILTVVFVVWKKRRAKCKNKKSEEDGAGQAGKEKTKNSKNDTSGSQVVEGEREPLMTGREEENDVDSREEQRHEDERETKQDQFLLETEQVRNINSPREKRINLSAVNEKESLITVEEKTQDMAGREEERKETKQNDHKKQTKKETKQRRNINSSGTKTSAMTETEPQFEMKQEAHEEQSRRGRHETHNVDIRGEQRYKDDIKMSRTGEDRINQFIKTENVSQSTTEQETHEEEMTGMKAERAEGGREKKMEAGKNYLGLQFLQQPIVFGKESKSFNFSFHLSSDQEPWREKETQQEQLGEKRQMERNVDMKKSDTEKQRAEENGDEGNNLDSVFVAQKETQREKLEVEKQREENQRRLQSETRREREKDETELKTRKDNKNQHHTEEKTVRTNRRIKKVERENQRDKKGMTERKRDEQRGQTESRISSVSSKVPLSTDLKIQDKTQGQNHEKQPENTSQQSREQIREQPEKLRGAERKEGAQGKELEVNEGLKSEETNRKYKRREKLQLSHEGELQVEQQVNINQKEQLEKSVSLTGRGVDCVEKKQEEEPMEEASDADQNNIQSRKHTEEIKLQEVCTLQDKKEEIQAGHHQNFKKVQKYVNKQNDQFMEVDDFAHNQSAATAQLNETIQRANHQQRLPVQTEPQEFLKENNEDLEDLMEVEEHSHPKEPKEEPMLLLEEKSSNFPLPLYTDQKPWRKKETQGQLVEKTQRMESEVLEVNQGLKSEETMRKAKETGVDCLQGKQEEELMETDQTCDADQKDDNYRKRSAEPELQDFCTLLIKKQKVQEERRARKRQNYKKLKK